MKNLIEKYGLQPRFESEALMYPNLTLARVIAQYRGKYRVVTADSELLVEISGKLRHETDELAKYPTVGDYVMIEGEIIHNILTRKSVFVRKAVGVSGQAQAVSANIDTVFICMSLNNNYNLNRLERYISVAWDSGATPVIVLTKSDLADDLDSMVYEAEKASSFCDVITISMHDDDVISKFEPYFKKGITGVFIGSSGVGKSTLINKLLGEEIILTSEIGKGDKGRHTTTGREMFICPLGGTLIDTAGMRELGIDGADLSTSFEDIEEIAKGCKYSDCTHTSEPDCAVLSAVDAGDIDKRRLDNYFKLLNETSYDGLSSKELEKKKADRMFKDVGGMKNVRKFIKNKNRF